MQAEQTTETPADTPHDWRAQVDETLARLSAEMQANTAITSEVREILSTLRGGMRVLAWLGNFVRWTVPFVGLAAALVGLWHQLKGGPK